jgi:hypothetical protein
MLPCRRCFASYSVLLARGNALYVMRRFTPFNGTNTAADTNDSSRWLRSLLGRSEEGNCGEVVFVDLIDCPLCKPSTSISPHSQTDRVQ